MGSFSQEMRDLAIELCTELGNKCALTKVVGGKYNPATGKTENVIEKTINTYCAQEKKATVFFDATGINTNLADIYSERLLVPWPGEPIDTTWQLDGQNITHVEQISAQDDVIVYIVEVGSYEGNS